MDWPGHVEAGTIRALWLSAQSRFSPLNGWPPPGDVGLLVDISGRLTHFTDIQAALSVVASNSALWEAQAQIIDYCSQAAGDWAERDRAGEDPAPQWATLADLGLYSDRQAWRGQGGLLGFLADADVAVPYHALASAGRIMSGAFTTDTLNGLGYTVAVLPDLEECLVLCNGDPACIRTCLRGKLG